MNDFDMEISVFKNIDSILVNEQPVECRVVRDVGSQCLILRFKKTLKAGDEVGIIYSDGRSIMWCFIEFKTTDLLVDGEKFYALPGKFEDVPSIVQELNNPVL